MRWSFLVLVCVGFLFGTGCRTGPNDICNPKCDCEGCSSRDFDKCVDDFFDDEEEASRRDCLPEFDTYMECQEATWVCRDDDFETDCRSERRRLEDCLD